jgi:hypothetical protein
MSGFENYAHEAEELELELTRKGVALGLDWSDPVAVRLLAREALNEKAQDLGNAMDDPLEEARIEFFGLAQLMLKVMTESAGQDIHTHGGPTWKIFAKALWEEHTARQAVGEP